MKKSINIPKQTPPITSDGLDGYPGYQPGGENKTPGSTPPEAGDADPGATRSADETGQGGDPYDPKKKTGGAWSG